MNLNHTSSGQPQIMQQQQLHQQEHHIEQLHHQQQLYQQQQLVPQLLYPTQITGYSPPPPQIINYCPPTLETTQPKYQQTTPQSNNYQTRTKMRMERKLSSRGKQSRKEKGTTQPQKKEHRDQQSTAATGMSNFHNYQMTPLTTPCTQMQ
jgi:hypothetical protein